MIVNLAYHIDEQIEGTLRGGGAGRGRGGGGGDSDRGLSSFSGWSRELDGCPQSV